MDTTRKGALIASAVASMFVACGGSAPAPASPSAADGAGASNVKCVGLNECKGKGVCAQDSHACGGKNECKGKGVTLLSASECAAKGGKAI